MRTLALHSVLNSAFKRRSHRKMWKARPAAKKAIRSVIANRYLQGRPGK